MNSETDGEWQAASSGNGRTFRMEESGLCGSTSVTTAVCVSGHTLPASACDHLRTTHTHTHTHINVSFVAVHATTAEKLYGTSEGVSPL